MAVRRVCSKIASRSNVRAFLPGRKEDSQSLTRKAKVMKDERKLCLYVPNPENPITDAMSPSPLIVSGTNKASVIYLLKYDIAKPF